MESIYYVMCWLCHRSCRHCYDERFKPYRGGELEKVVAEAVETFPRVIGNLPARMTFLDPGEPELGEQPGSVILAGGEILLEPVREKVLYPALEMLHARYSRNGGVRLIVQTTGDVLTRRIAAELRERRVWTISVSGIDSFHDGLESDEQRRRLMARVSAICGAEGFQLAGAAGSEVRRPPLDGRYYHFFGATPDNWIGKLWPRGRAAANGLSTASLADNFCARWSGGIGFLDAGLKGSEVSIEPDGSVYPCCLKTKLPVGNVSREPLEGILARLRGNPVYEAIHRGEPQKMGLAHGWSEETFREKSRTTLPDGRVYENLCVGCDRFHEEVLMAARGLVRIKV